MVNGKQRIFHLVREVNPSSGLRQKIVPQEEGKKPNS